MEKSLFLVNKSVKEAIAYMEEKDIKALVIVDEERKIKGLFSHGDMRRYFLKGGELSANIQNAMNAEPIVFSNRQEAEQRRREKPLVIYPIINEERVVIDILFERESIENEQVSSILSTVPLVIMAGGKGTRLFPYTKILPKALIPIGDYTIMERIIKVFERYGCNKVFTVINYKGNMIKAYFNELDKDYSMDFVEETEFLGTGGGLSLLKGMIDNTFFLSNCDILVNADLECVYKTHKMNGNKITIVCAMKNMQIPYGIVETNDEGGIQDFKEKPEFSFLTNTGLYLIEPEVIDSLNEGEFVHFPDIAKRYLERGEKVGVFPIPESAWMDMGQFKEMDVMMKTLGV
ncbi:MAG: NTP transferase domain-containing protein [Lachnospiraceae bacterium]|nr:NTP transferase domain-containing protein [Lachnospiraceae bacterium]